MIEKNILIFQCHGGDPVSVQIIDGEGKLVAVNVIDKDDGTYEARFTPLNEGTYCLKVAI